MRIKTISLKDFRRFTNLTISLGEQPKKIIIMTGPNGCGKSCVFDAIVTKIQQYRGGAHTPAYASKSLYLEDDKTATDNPKQVIEIDVIDGAISQDSFYFRTAYRYAPQIQVNGLKAQTPISEDEHRPTNSISIDRRLTSNYEHLISTFYDDVYGKEITGLAWMEQNINQINQALAPILDIKITSLGDPLNKLGSLYFEKGASRNFPYENLSSGEKEIVDLILDLIVKTKHFKDTVFCIDEPELHINTSIQKKLLIELNNLIPDSCQLWIATHSIGFLRAAQEELKNDTSILDFSHHNFDDAVTLRPITPSRDNWKRIFTVALEDLTGLISPKTIIYCEGKVEPDRTGKGTGLDEVIYNQIFSSEFPEVLFVSSGGQTQPDKYSEIALVVLNKAFNKVDLLLLKDCDINSDGTQTTLEQRTNWIQEDPSRRKMLKRKEIENYLYDIEILQKAYPNLNEVEYNNLVHDIQNYSVKDISHKIMALCGVNGGTLSKEDFKKQLAKYITKDTRIYNELREVIFDLIPSNSNNTLADDGTKGHKIGHTFLETD